jgi:hypothetical protein
MKHETATSVRRQVSAEEWDVRVNLAAAYRLVALNGWDDLVFTHVSARVPGSEHHFLINPYGMLFEEITASSLVKIDLGGRKIMDSPHEINPAGFTIHSCIPSGSCGLALQARQLWHELIQAACKSQTRRLGHCRYGTTHPRAARSLSAAVIFSFSVRYARRRPIN